MVESLTLLGELYIYLVSEVSLNLYIYYEDQPHYCLLV
jgi:hypothetical protein